MSEEVVIGTLENDLGILQGAVNYIRTDANNHQGQMSRELRKAADTVQGALDRVKSRLDGEVKRG